MERVTFTSDRGTSEALRPTHALMIAGETAGRPMTGALLAAACEAVRTRYRCRTVRKELRRVRLLAEAAGDGPITTTCRDAAALAAFEETRRAG